MRHLLAALTLLCAVAGAQSTCGDCDGSGAVDVLDALRGAQMDVALIPVTPADLDVCDVDSSGVVNVLDALRMAQAAAQLNPSLICPSTPNTPPQAAGAAVPGSPVSGTVMLSYNLLDAESNPCTVTVGYSTSSGATYLPATPGAGGDGGTGLASSPGGVPHTWAWDSLADLGFAVVPGVLLRVTPTDIVVGTPSVTSAFTVDNSGLNTPPTASAVAPVAPLTGDIAVGYTLADPESDTCSIAVDISLDGGVTFPIAATAAPGGDGTGSLAASPGGTAHTYMWDSLADTGPVLESSVVVRITPSDLAPGTPGSSAPFAVDNVPVVSFTSDVYPLFTSLGCVNCHPPPANPNWHGTPAEVWAVATGCCVDLQNPSSSLLLLKPLAPAAGGLNHNGGIFFNDTQDPNYQTILSWITQGALLN